MIPDYDRVASFYDPLSRLVFGKKQAEARLANIDLVRPGDRILIVGGGSGQLLKSLDDLGIDCNVDFVEVSRSMMKRARHVELENISVNYHQVDIMRFDNALKFDVVFTNFFFDQFNEADCKAYLEHIMSLCQPEAFIAYADFIPPVRLKDRITKVLMYQFFRTTVGLGKVQLIDHKIIFQQSGLVLIKSESISSFIKAEVYKIS